MRSTRFLPILAAALVLASCGESSGGGGSSNVLRHALTVNFADGTLRRYAVEDATGRVHPSADTTPIADPWRAIINPQGTRLYVINKGPDTSVSTDDGISVYDIDADGTLTEIAGSPFSGVDKWPVELLMHPNGLFLYVLNSQFLSKNVTQFAIDPVTGALTEIGTEVPTGDSGAGITIDSTNSYIYVCNVNGDDVTQYEIQPDGTLAEIGSEIATGCFPISIAAHPTEPYVYCANSNDGTITQFEIGVDGTLSEIGTRIEVRLDTNVPPVPINGLGEIRVHPSGNWVYVTHTNAGPTLVQYEVLPNGTLSEIGTPQDIGNNAVVMKIDPTGSYIYVIGTGDKSIWTFAINPDGTAEPVAPGEIRAPDSPIDIVFLTGDTPLEPVSTFAYATDVTNDEVDQFTIAADGTLGALGSDAAGSAPAGIAATFDGRFVYTVDSTNDLVLPFAANAAGELSALATVATGDNPTHCVVTPDGRYVYVLDADDLTVSQFSIAANGTLTPLTNATDATSTDPRGIAVHPSSRYAYVVHAGTKLVWGYLAGTDGELTKLGATPVTGNGPSSITVHPDGTYAYVTNEDDDTVSMYSIGDLGQLGILTPFTVATGDAPRSLAVEPAGLFAYVANSGDNTISQYSVGADGQLAPIGTPVGAGTTPTVLRTEPTGRYLYAIADGAILRYTIGNNGLLTLTAGSVAMDAADLVTLGIWD